MSKIYLAGFFWMTSVFAIDRSPAVVSVSSTPIHDSGNVDASPPTEDLVPPTKKVPTTEKEIAAFLKEAFCSEGKAKKDLIEFATADIQVDEAKKEFTLALLEPFYGKPEKLKHLDLNSEAWAVIMKAQENREKFVKKGKASIQDANLKTLYTLFEMDPIVGEFALSKDYQPVSIKELENAIEIVIPKLNLKYAYPSTKISFDLKGLPLQLENTNTSKGIFYTNSKNNKIDLCK